MRIVPQVAMAMQAVFGKSLDELAKSTGCVQRERKFSGSSLLEMLVFTLLLHPAAKDRDYRNHRRSTRHLVWSLTTGELKLLIEPGLLGPSRVDDLPH